MVGSFLDWESACDLGSIYENAPRKVKIRSAMAAEKDNRRIGRMWRVIDGAA